MQQAQLNIEDILQSQGVLSPTQVSAIKLESINTGKSADKIILERHFAPEEKVVQAKAQILGIPYINVQNKAISPETLNYVPEGVARRYLLIPFEKDLDSISVAMADPLDLQVIQFLEKKTNLQVKRFLGSEEDILKAINNQYSQNITTEVVSALKEVTGNEEEVITEAQRAQQTQPLPSSEMIKEAPVSNIVTHLLEFALKTKASDIHIEPEETQTRIRYRIDGILHEKVILPKKVHDAVISRVKILSNLKIDEHRLPQDGRFTFTQGDQEIDLRISTLPTVYGEKVVMRLLQKSERAPTLQDLGLRGTALKNLEVQMTRPHGIILICGPTGSGKTTTLYSILSKLSTARVNVSTIEDPVEYQIPGANQVQVNPAIGLTFATALRAFLRQDPNIILVGEIRDTETAELAIQAALTGHQVFSTIHTNSASGALPRLLDMGAESFLVASAMNAAVGQRILRKICSHCQVAYTPPPEIIQNIQHVLGNLFPVNQQAPIKSGQAVRQPADQQAVSFGNQSSVSFGNRPIQLYKGNGCGNCGYTGYSGRTGIYEVLPITDKITKLILQRASSLDIEKVAVEEGMITLKQDGYLKALEGMTTMEEVLRVGQD